MKKIFIKKDINKLFKYNNHLIQSTVQKRTAVVMGVSFFIKLALVGGSTALLFSYNKISRSPLAQMRRIEKQFKKRLDVIMPVLYLPRPESEEILRNRFDSTPTGPLVIIGQEGSGKSAILKKISLERGPTFPTVFMDFQSQNVDNPAELLYAFASKIGFKVPNDNFLFRWLLKEKVSNDRVLSNIEIDKCFDALQRMLLKEKHRGHPNGIPLVSLCGIEKCIQPDQLIEIFKEKVETKKEMGKEKKPEKIDKQNPNISKIYYAPQMKKLLNFIIYATDNQLAHFAIVTNNAFSEVLDNYSPWRLRRELVWVSYPPDKVIKDYLTEDCSEWLSKRTGGIVLTPNEVDHVINCLGGSLNDIVTAVSGFERDLSVYDTVDRLVLDSSSKIIGILESYYDKGMKYEGTELEEYYLGAYLRLWALAQTLMGYPGGVRRSFLLREIFQGQSKELKYYESISLICTYPQTAEGVQELEVTAEEVKKMHQNRPIESVLSERIERIYCQAGSRRVLLSFKLVLANKLMLEMTEQTKLKFSRLELLKQKKTYEENLDAWYKRAKIISDEYSSFVENKELFLQETAVTEEKEKPVVSQQSAELEIVNEDPKTESLHYFHYLLNDRNNVQKELDFWNIKLRDVMIKLNEIDQKLKNMNYIATEHILSRFQEPNTPKQI